MSHYESPSYEVLVKEDSYELRKYTAFYLVEYSNNSDPDIANGFRTLFSYISSNNKSNQKISMTIPVIEDLKGNNKRMAFVVPKAFGSDIPKPNSKDLNITEFEAGLYAVVQYSGRSNEALEQQKSRQLHQWIEKNHWEVRSNDKLAIFNAPFTPGIFRKNEIMVKVNVLSEI